MVNRSADTVAPDEQALPPDASTAPASGPVDLRALAAEAAADDRRYLDEMRGGADDGDAADDEDQDAGDADEFGDELNDGDESEDEDLTGEQGDEEGEDEGNRSESEPEQSEDARLEGYANTLWHQPQRWSEIPTADRPKAIERLAQKALFTGAKTMEQQLLAAVGEVYEKDRLAGDDPDAFADWQSEHPTEAARYWQIKARLQPLDAPPATPNGASQPGAAQGHPLRKIATDAIATLTAEARTRLAQRHNLENFQESDESYAALMRDIGVESARAELTDDEEVARARRRTEADRRRRGTARPHAGGRAAPSTRPDPVEAENDPHKLLQMAAAAESDRARNGDLAPAAR